ncbi:MAG: hypothetical protein AAB821_01850, partial [Patescibacteria group bacterium]
KFFHKTNSKVFGFKGKFTRFFTWVGLGEVGSSASFTFHLPFVVHKFYTLALTLLLPKLRPPARPSLNFP